MPFAVEPKRRSEQPVVVEAERIGHMHPHAYRYAGTVQAHVETVVVNTASPHRHFGGFPFVVDEMPEKAPLRIVPFVCFVADVEQLRIFP